MSRPDTIVTSPFETHYDDIVKFIEEYLDIIHNNKEVVHEINMDYSGKAHYKKYMRSFPIYMDIFEPLLLKDNKLIGIINNMNLNLRCWLFRFYKQQSSDHLDLESVKSLCKDPKVFKKFKRSIPRRKIYDENNIRLIYTQCIIRLVFDVVVHPTKTKYDYLQFIYHNKVRNPLDEECFAVVKNFSLKW